MYYTQSIQVRKHYFHEHLELISFQKDECEHSPVMTSRPFVADSRVSPVSRCLVLHWYDLYPSSGPTSLICNSPDGSTKYFPSKKLKALIDVCYVD